MTASISIRRWAPVFNVLSIIAIVVIVVAVAASALFGDLPLDIRAAAGVAPEVALSRGMLAVVALIGALPAVAMVYVLVRMSGLFRSYAMGETLTPLCAGHIRAIGVGLLTMAVLGFVARPIQIVLASLGNPPGERVLAVGFGSMELGLVLAGGLLLTIGWAMADAVRAAQENAEIV